MDKPKKVAALVILGALVVAGILVVVLNANNTSDSAGQPVQDVAASATTSPSVTYPQCADFLDNYFIRSPLSKANEATSYGWTFRLYDDAGSTSWESGANGKTWIIGAVEKNQSTCSVRFKVVPGPDIAPASPPAVTGPLTTVSEGTYLVGTDMAAGSYKSPGSANGCYWARLKDDAGRDIIANDYIRGPGPARFTAKKGEYVKISRCTFTKI